jgi:hypothetical protein
MRAKEKAKKENNCDKCTHEHCNPCYDFENFTPKNKTLFDFKEPEKTLFCHNWKKTVTLSYCLEKCTSQSCQDTEELVKLQS